MNIPFGLPVTRSLSSETVERHMAAKLLDAQISNKQKQNTHYFHQHNYFDTENLLISLHEGSRFDAAQHSARQWLNRVMKHEAFKAQITLPKTANDHWLMVDPQGHVYQATSTPVLKIQKLEAESLTELKNDIELIAKVAEFCGGFVCSSNTVPLANWLQFHQLALPKTIEDARNLIALLTLELPKPPLHGNYWGNITDSGEPDLFIEAHQHSLIYQSSYELLKKHDEARPERLINRLTEALLEYKSEPCSRELPRQNWPVLLETTEAQRVARRYANALDLPLSALQTSGSTELRSQILTAAILLDLALGRQDKNSDFRHAHLYTPSNVQASAHEVRRKVTGLLTNGVYRVSEAAAPLAAELILAGLAPEFLVDAPASVWIGSPEWVMLRKAVMLAEHIAPGLSLNLSYEKLMELTAIAPVSPQQQTLHDWLTVRCICDWAMVNQLVPDPAHTMAQQEFAENAIKLFTAHTQALAEAQDAIGAAPVSRRRIARDELLDIGYNPLTKLYWPMPRGTYRSATLIDVYLANALKKKIYDYKVGTSLYRDPDVLTLPAINGLYAQSTTQHHQRYTAGIATLLQLALSRLSQEDRAVLEQGKVALYYVRDNLSIPFSGGVDWRKNRRAGFGVVVLCRFQGHTHCFEVFPGQGLCRRHPALATAYINGSTLNESKTWFTEGPNGDNDTFQSLTAMHNAPFDTGAYFRGTPPQSALEHTTANMGMERFAELDYNNVPSTPPLSPMSSFHSARFRHISQLIAEHASPLTYEHFYAIGYDKTDIEQRNEDFSRTVDTLLNVVIPFKSCIEGLTSSDADRRSDAVFDCIMDATAVVTVFAGGAGLFAKALASSSRLLNLCKVTARLALSLFNPLDGVPPLIHGGARIAIKSALELSHLGKTIARNGAKQLRLLSGNGGSYDLLKALNKSGSAAEIRMALPTVAHGRAVLKDDTLETARQVLKTLSNKEPRLEGISGYELEYLFNAALIEAALQSKPVQALETLIGKQALDEWLGGVMSTYYMNYDNARRSTDFVESVQAFVRIDAANIEFMSQHQQALLKQDLNAAPFDGVMPEMHFNSEGFIDDVDRAAAWILQASNSQGNDVHAFKDILREYRSGRQSLVDPAVIRDLHKRLVPAHSPALRAPRHEARYPSSISGSALLHRHLATLDVSHEHFAKQLYAAVTGFHAFTDGNGRTARTLYAIHQLRARHFHPMSHSAEAALSGLG